MNDNIPKRIKRLWGVTLFRGQQSKAARDRERERSGGELPIVHHEEAAPQACRLMDDEVVRMLIFKGRLVSGEQGLRGNFVFFIYLWFCFVSSNNRKQKYRAVSWQRNSGSGQEKKLGKGKGRKEKPVDCSLRNISLVANGIHSPGYHDTSCHTQAPRNSQKNSFQWVQNVAYTLRSVFIGQVSRDLLPFSPPS